MTSTSKLLATRHARIAKMAELIREFITAAGETIARANPSDHSAAASALDTIAQAVVPDVSLNITCINDIYMQMAQVDTAIDRLISIVTIPIYLKYLSQKLSASAMVALTNAKTKIVELYTEHKTTSADMDEQIFDKVLDTSAAAVSAMYEFLMAHPDQTNKFTARMMGLCIRHLKGERRRRVELLIETQKDAVLGCTRIPISHNKGPQGLVVRYGLRPVTVSYELEKIFSILEAPYNSKASVDGNLEALARGGPGIILLNNSSNSPIEFDMRGLIDLEYVVENNLKTPPLAGVNKKILTRYNTVVTHTRTGAADKIKKFKGTTDDWYVFETIDGHLYRVLGRDNVGAVAGNSIRGIFEGLSSRGHTYNSIQEDIILSKCFDPNAILMLNAYEDYKVTAESSEPLKAAIRSDLIADFVARANKHPRKDIKWFRLDALASRDDASEIVLRSLMKTVNSKTPENLVTCAAKFEAVVNNFTRELERRWLSQGLEDQFFRERSAAVLSQVLIEIYGSIIDRVSDEIDKADGWLEHDIALKEFCLERKQHPL